MTANTTRMSGCVYTQPEVPPYAAGHVGHQRLGAWRKGELARERELARKGELA